MKPFKVAPFRTIDPAALRLAARELGHGLNTRSASELASVRRELSLTAEANANQYARGFFDAIESLLAGLSSEVKHRSSLAQDVASAHVRKNAAKVLVALDSGCTLPSEIAQKTQLSAPAVSSELVELESERLVERVKRAPGEDQRTSPRALTIRGTERVNTDETVVA